MLRQTPNYPYHQYDAMGLQYQDGLSGAFDGPFDNAGWTVIWVVAALWLAGKLMNMSFSSSRGPRKRREINFPGVM